jgi:hypothetical protein
MNKTLTETDLHNIIIIIIIIIIITLQPFDGSWALFQFLDPIHSR